MDNFNRRICRNVKALCKMNFIRLGDLEEELGHMPGYLSRNPKIPADEMVQIAEKFHMSIDDLIKGDFELTVYKVEQKNKLLEVVTALRSVYTKDELMKVFIQMVNTLYKEGEEQ